MIFLWKKSPRLNGLIAHTQKAEVLSDLSLVRHNKRKADMVFITRAESDAIIKDTGELQAQALKVMEAAPGYVKPKRQRHIDVYDYWKVLGSYLGVFGKMVIVANKQPVGVTEALLEAIKAPQRGPVVKGMYSKKNKEALCQQ